MIVRVYAWLIILGNDGLLERVYRMFGGADISGFLFTPGAMITGMVYSYIPQLALWCGHRHGPFGPRGSGAVAQRPARQPPDGGNAMKQHNSRSYPGLRPFSILFFLWLYLPIAVVVIYSFNDNRLVSVWTGFSTKWYATALANAALMGALEISLKVAVISTVCATLIALLAAIVLTRATDLKFRRVSETVVNLPLILPEIVLAVAVLILFSQIGLTNGLLKLVLAHTAFCTPFAFLPIQARLQGMSLDFEEAARDLYASPFTAFRLVTLPMILPGLFAGAMTAFVMSMDDFITSNLLNSGGATTLPVYIFSLIRQGTTPELNAISTLLIAASLIMATLVLILNVRAMRRG
ncbi:ABC transporter permease subunit [uncultured Celeribacter sp.]|uniref:ABC transporter permease n=1 Tax=uncultured Celeribacter sp. TaxID=1303376 RepID=UPI002AA78B3C|nr:ABC transporter permease subunit [uncultured Celeribacter sp.]